MSLKQQKNGKWLLDFWPAGRGGPHVRKVFRTKREAEHFEVQEKAKAQSAGSYVKPKRDTRKLSDLAQEWYDEHGYLLTSGKKRLVELNAVIRSLNDPLAVAFTSNDFKQYMRERLETRRTEGFKPENDINHKLAYAKAMFNVLIKSGSWGLANPLENVSKLTMQERELTFLTIKQMNQLLSELGTARNTDVLAVAKICLSVGARWGEAESLTRKDIHHGKVHFNKTKNGRNRSIPISDDLEREIVTDRPAHGRLFGPCKDALNNGLERAGIELPRGQKSHVLRHTFASHFMMAGGNLLTLNKILGHQTIQMTMRYAHLAPEHLTEAKSLNPLVVSRKRIAA
ncbi:phage integrase [Gilvimarinus japonicus]|uniref:Tyrosine-type recombinase/integrase n=1 Tax=Gilvimarinus japonicus TaxID=1796469 RepID=A0ABV7HV90_9GAMM